MTAHYMTMEELTTPKRGLMVLPDHWWWSKDGMILDWRIGKHRSPQCNASLDVMRATSHLKMYAGHEPVFVPLAYYPIST